MASGIPPALGEMDLYHPMTMEKANRPTQILVEAMAEVVTAGAVGIDRQTPTISYYQLRLNWF
jgi:hypothetical protein